MGESLPTEYDCIVIGTGMTESVVAAAASRVGKRVLHLDSNEYYGGLWASFNFEGLQNWLADCRKQASNSEETPSHFSDLVKEGETLIKAGNQFSVFFNIEENWYISEDLAESLAGLSLNKKTQTDCAHDKSGSGDIEAEKVDDESEKHERDTVETEKDDEGSSSTPSQPKYWSQSKLKEEYRKFNLDLAPKLLFARGSLVELLISSNIARYAEFRSVTRVLTWLEGQLEPVPCSRADVFATRHVSVVEKRMLMKLLTACMQYDTQPQEFEGFEDKTFLEYLKSRKLTSNLIHYVLYSIAMAQDTTPCLEGVTRTKRFLNSLGRYGNTPFLWPMYGSGEIPQCFCRLCAVFGGVYHLKRAAEAVIVGPGLGDNCEKKCLGIMSTGQRLNTNQLVLGVGHAPPQFVETTPSGGLSRGIFITDRSILPADKESLTLLQFPSMDGKGEPITVIELGPSTNACPKGMHVVHMTCKQQLTAKEDLQHVVEKLLHNKISDTNVERVVTDTQSTQTRMDESGASGDDSEMEKSDKPDKSVKPLKPQVLWSLYFNCPETSNCDLSASSPPNVFVCSGPDLDLDFEFAVTQARDIFTKMYPNCEFLPRAPDPEEIIVEGDENVPGPSFEGTADMDESNNDQTAVEVDGGAGSIENAVGKE